MNRQIGDELMKCIINSWVKKQMKPTYEEYLKADTPKQSEFEAEMPDMHPNCKGCDYFVECDEEYNRCPRRKDL